MSDDYQLSFETGKTYSRIVRAPDNLDYLVNLDGWYWNALDWFIAEDGWTIETFARLAWNLARKMEEAGTMAKPGDFKEEFQGALGDTIFELVHCTAARDNGHENDNKPPE